MKQIFFTLLSLLPVIIFSQTESGEISYTETVKLQIDIPEGNEEIRNSIPNSQSITKKLIFTAHESYYTDDAVNKDMEIKQQNNGMDMQIVMKNPQNNIYTNHDKNLLIQSTELFGKYFLVSGNLDFKKWKLSTGQKQIASYTCQKAILSDTTQQIVAWYTTELPAYLGPAGYAQLPGTVLGIDVDNGQRSIIATKINFRPVATNEIIKPAKGKKVSSEEYKKIRDDKMKEMGIVNGKSGAMKMIIREERD
jgi:GLPGLI family protein